MEVSLCHYLPIIEFLRTNIIYRIFSGYTILNSINVARIKQLQYTWIHGYHRVR